jgi:hypothetical protein
MTLAWLLLLTGLTISAVAIYYSVIGLAAVFAAAAVPVYIMGTTLEVAKLVCASWLKANWERIPALMKLYMTTAVVVLMLITSMGIFGFLSKAHLDQNIVSGDVQSKIALVDEKIKIERENIADAQQVIKQMDAAVTGVIATGDQTVTLRNGSTRVNSAAERSLQIRRSQAKDRAALTKQIEESQTRIVTLQEEVAPIRAEMRQVEAKVGPIKYIAALIYGDNPDANILEKAVTWVIIIIVVVFDPLAIIMLLAAQMSFQWHRKDLTAVLPAYEQDDSPLTTDQLEQIKETFNQKVEPVITKQFIDHGEHPKDNFGYEHTQTEVPSETPLTALGGDITAPEEPVVASTAESELEKWNKMVSEAERAVEAELDRGEELLQAENISASTDDSIESSKKKTYMTKNLEGKIEIKNRD